MSISDHDLVKNIIMSKLKNPNQTKNKVSLIIPEIEDVLDCVENDNIARVIDELYLIDKELSKQRSLSQKHLDLYKLMCTWVEIKQKNISFEIFLLNCGYQNIGIYGMHYVGERLYEELMNSSIQILFTIDRGIRTNTSQPNGKIKSEVADAIIVTPITFFEEIEADLRKEYDCSIISIQTILDDMLRTKEGMCNDTRKNI